ncbi:hypothetical protein BYT27DRAFT_7215436 [Phlegmacium glaucopus]|nr:hypothetical protein BYT27DRAFT_7215436 [Phlegmacium glaucopus]
MNTNKRRVNIDTQLFNTSKDETSNEQVFIIGSAVRTGSRTGQNRQNWFYRFWFWFWFSSMRDPLVWFSVLQKRLKNRTEPNFGNTIAADSGIRELSQSDVAKKFNEAIIGAGGNVMIHKIRTVERLVNNGILGEFLTDNGAKWLAQQSHADDFIAAFGALGLGTSIKKRNHPIIAYYVLLHLNTSNPAHFVELRK